MCSSLVLSRGRWRTAQSLRQILDSSVGTAPSQPCARGGNRKCRRVISGCAAWPSLHSIMLSHPVSRLSELKFGGAARRLGCGSCQ